MQYEYDGINAFLAGMSTTLLADGVRRETRGQVCYELPEPALIKIRKPTARLVTIPERGWNYALPYVESLWLALGQNDIAMVAHYVSNLLNFSDDKVFMRAGYGPRFRFYNGQPSDYRIDGVRKHHTAERVVDVDQFSFVLKSFEKDPYTRQAVITVGDPAKDTFASPGHLKETKDFPCTKSLHFQRNADGLDLIVHMRSNDFMWGASAVNIFNFTFIQEYFSQLLGLRIGTYYHVVDNLHYYEKHRKVVEQLAAVKDAPDVDFIYPKTFRTLADFDGLVKDLKQYEAALRTQKTTALKEFKDPFFDDWAKVLYAKTVGMRQRINFLHPVLNELRDQVVRNERSRELRKAVGSDGGETENAKKKTHE